MASIVNPVLTASLSALDTVLISNKRSFGNRSFGYIFPDVVLEERHVDELTITDHPIEVASGAVDRHPWIGRGDARRRVEPIDGVGAGTWPELDRLEHHRTVTRAGDFAVVHVVRWRRDGVAGCDVDAVAVRAVERDSKLGAGEADLAIGSAAGIDVLRCAVRRVIGAGRRVVKPPDRPRDALRIADNRGDPGRIRAVQRRQRDLVRWIDRRAGVCAGNDAAGSDRGDAGNDGKKPPG